MLELSGATRNDSISTCNIHVSVLAARVEGRYPGTVIWGIPLSLIAWINRPRRIPRKPPRDVYRRADTTARAWVDIPLVSGRAFCPRFPPPTVPPSPYGTPGGNIFSRLGRGRWAMLSRHGNGKRYSSCFRDTLTENTRVSSTYILSRGQGEVSAAVRLPCRTEGGLKPNCSDTRISLPPRRHAHTRAKYRVVQAMNENAINAPCDKHRIKKVIIDILYLERNVTKIIIV